MFRQHRFSKVQVPVMYQLPRHVRRLVPLTLKSNWNACMLLHVLQTG